MKKTLKASSVPGSGSRRKKLCQAFLAFLAASGTCFTWGQDGQSTARFTPLTPSVFRTASSETMGSTQSAFHRLDRVSGEQLTQLLVQGLGKHLQGRQEGSRAMIQLPVSRATDGTCLATIDRANHTVELHGNAKSVSAWMKVVQALDVPETQARQRALAYAPVPQHAALIQRLSQSVGLRPASRSNSQSVQMASHNGAGLGQARPANFQDETTPTGPPATPPDALQQPDGLPQDGEFQIPGSSIKVSVDPTGALIVTGTDEDIQSFQNLLAQLGEQALQSRPSTDVVPLEKTNSVALAAVIQQLYNDVFATRFGAATVTAISEPNALVVSGQPQALEELKAIIAKLDIESEDIRGSFVVLRLKHMAASNAANRLGNFFGVTPATTGGQLGGGQQNLNQPRTVLIIPDPRSNTIILKGGSTELRQAQELLNEIDVVDGENIKSQDMKVIQLRNSVATDMAQVIVAAINGGVQGATQALGSPSQQGFGFGQQQQLQNQQNQDPTVANSSLRLKLMSIDKNSGVISSGILFDVRIIADSSSNSLLISGPPESLPLVEALVRELDRLPDAETQLKVFTILNGDAEQLYNMLTQLFTQQQQQGGGGFGGGVQNDGLSRLPLRSGSSDQTLVSLRFALEARTNTIIAAGSAGDLQVVEDLLTSLDRTNGDRFIKKVYRLSNAPAEDTATTLTNTYNAEQQNLLSQDPTTQSAFVNVRRRVIVQADPIQNHLIVIATPETMVEIEGLITALDRRPTVVAIQVMIAEVALNSTEEFGLELGVQDSIVFDRGLAGTNVIGYPFNQAGSGNSLTGAGLASREKLAGQGLINLGVGRSNAGLGYGGLVLSAGNESINILMRALKDQGRLQVLSRPHLMTIDNLNARVQVGQRVPYNTGTTTTQGVVQLNTTLQDVGIILEVVPRVGPDGLITMLVNVTNSSIGNEAEGTALGTDSQGNTIRQAPINITESITTAIARSDQTVILSGLLRTSKQFSKRGIPILSDLPRLGPLFSFQSERELRSELLIFLTPTIVHSHEDMAMLNQVEMDRMNWCFQDVMDLHGPIGNIYQGTFADGSGPEEVYPELRTPGIPQYESHGMPHQTAPDSMYEIVPPTVPQPLGQNASPTDANPTGAPPTGAAAGSQQKTSGLSPLWRKNQ